MAWGLGSGQVDGLCCGWGVGGQEPLSRLSCFPIPAFTLVLIVFQTNLPPSRSANIHFQKVVYAFFPLRRAGACNSPFLSVCNSQQSSASRLPSIPRVEAAPHPGLKAAALPLKPGNLTPNLPGGTGDTPAAKLLFEVVTWLPILPLGPGPRAGSRGGDTAGRGPSGRARGSPRHGVSGRLS